MKRQLKSCLKNSSFYTQDQCKLDLYSTGKIAGIVFDSGFRSTHSVTIYDDIMILNSTINNNFGGSDLTYRLNAIINSMGYKLYTESDKISVNKVKEELCYVAFDYDKELQSFKAGL